LRRKSFNDLAEIKIVLYNSTSLHYTLDNLDAATYNLNAGEVAVTNVNNDNIFKQKDGLDTTVTFTFPNLNEGSIIEYRYFIRYPNLYIPPWEFQGNYPKLWSEYTTEIPDYFDFAILSHGFLKPVIDTGTVINYKANKSATTFGASVSFTTDSRVLKHSWAFENIPEVKKEIYTTALSNYKQMLEFQLTSVRLPDMPDKNYDWTHLVKELMKDENFGQDIYKNNDWLNDDLKSLPGESDPLKKAIDIFRFVQKNYLCLDHSAIYLSQPLKKTQKERKGNVADINILLIAMLYSANLDVQPVLLSTREHGKTYDVYPILSKYNYVIARLKINDQTYLLDASDKNIGFGFLPPDCYNDNATVVAQRHLTINLTSDSLHEKKLTAYF
jgi:hypothetical protein